MTMYGLSFNSPKKEWPIDQCNVSRCRAKPDFLYKDVQLWGNRPPRDVYLCKKHDAKMRTEAGDAEVPNPHIIEHGVQALATQANQRLAESKDPMAQFRSAVEIWAEQEREYLTEFEFEALGDLEAAQAFEIITQDDVVVVNECLKSVKKDLKDIEARRTKNTKPVNELKRTIDSWYKKSKDTLFESKTVFEKKLKQHRLAGQQKSELLIAQAVGADAPQVQKDALVSANEARQQHVDGLSYIDNWKFVVEDPAQVPATFLCPDVEKIKAFVKEHKGQTSIPGVRVYNDPIVRNG